MKILLVEDESYAVDDLRAALLSIEPALEVETATNAREAIDLIVPGKFEAIFLDIELPGMDGIEMLRMLQPLTTPVVLCTAHALSALDAFGLGVVDCLLKPIEPERLTSSLNKVRQFRNSVKTVAASTVVTAAEPQAASPVLNSEQYLFVTSGERIYVVPLSEVMLLEEQSEKTKVFHEDGAGLVSECLLEISKRLPEGQFVRLSTGSLVNLKAIFFLAKDDDKGWCAHLSGDTVITIDAKGLLALRELGFNEGM